MLSFALSLLDISCYDSNKDVFVKKKLELEHQDFESKVTGLNPLCATIFSVIFACVAILTNEDPQSERLKHDEYN